MNKRRVCPVCYGRAHVNKLAKINAKTGWYDFYYLVRCENCLTEVKSDLKEAIEIFPTYEAEEVKAESAQDIYDYAQGIEDVHTFFKETDRLLINSLGNMLCGLNDRTSLSDISRDR